MSRRELSSSANMVVTATPAARVQTSVTSATQALSHIDAIAGPTSVAKSAATGGAETTVALASLMPAITATPGSSLIATVLLMGAVNAINQRTVHAKATANATSAPTTRRAEWATPAMTGLGTKGTIPGRP